MAVVVPAFAQGIAFCCSNELHFFHYFGSLLDDDVGRFAAAASYKAKSQ